MSSAPGAPADLLVADPAVLAEIKIGYARVFTDYTGRYLLHCHNLEHEDMAMMAEFETTH
ncbi:MAG: hypothetical protein QOJ50_1092 [Cryptosporangiaceae bacterium]|nr:hypothetical protein [Cryptosporangiaceae bacterium]